jgi:RNA polymerase sigma factor (sigma-70 family)
MATSGTAIKAVSNIASKRTNGPCSCRISSRLGLLSPGTASRVEGTTRSSLFERTIVPHLHAAHNLALWLTRDEQDAQDVVQEAYLRAFRFFDGFSGRDGKAWLLAVVRNTCLTWRRQKWDETTMVLFDERSHCFDQATNAETKMVNEVKLRVLRNCIESLPRGFREVIVMREMEEMSYREIAGVAGLPIGTVMSRLSRARKRLEACVTGRMKGGSE